MNHSYYNEIDPYAAQWLRNLIAAGHIAPGDVDERSIVDVRPDDLKGYTQCHFFAGIGGWSYAARLAGWSDDRQIWTGSCPCQPFSVAGAGKGQADERHLWPIFFDLIRAVNPAVVMGEQVAAAVGKHWLDGVHSDLESIGYAVGAAVVPACAVDAPHRRDRLWFVANADSNGPLSRADNPTARYWHTAAADDRESAVADPDQPSQSQGREQRGRELGWSGGDQVHSAVADAVRAGRSERRTIAGPRSAAWDGSAHLSGVDGKARRVEPSIRLLAHGVPARVGKLRAYGNAIVSQVAAEVIGAYLDTERLAA